MILEGDDYHAHFKLLEKGAHLEHYGILRESGRYPWGSGNNPAQRSKTFIDTLAELRAEGLSDVEIARGFSTEEYPFTVKQLREVNTIARAEKKQADIAYATRLKDKGYSPRAIGEKWEDLMSLLFVVC